MPPDIERQGPGRREADASCEDHDTRLTKVEKILNVQYGWLKAAGVFFAVILPILGYLGMSIDNKLTTIISKQSVGDVAFAEIRRDIGDHEVRIKKIESRHDWLDQNGVVTKRPGR